MHVFKHFSIQSSVLVSASGKQEYQFQREIQNFVKSKWIKKSILIRQITFFDGFFMMNEWIPECKELFTVRYSQSTGRKHVLTWLIWQNMQENQIAWFENYTVDFKRASQKLLWNWTIKGWQIVINEESCKYCLIISRFLDPIPNSNVIWGPMCTF